MMLQFLVRGKLHTVLLIWTLFVTIVPTMLAVYAFHNHAEAALEKAAMESVNNIALQGVNTINNWQKNYAEYVANLANNPHIKSMYFSKT